MKLKHIVLKKCPVLEEFACYTSAVEELDTKDLPNLKKLFCYQNQIKALDLSKNPLLETLQCNSNLLESLNVSGSPDLKVLFCDNNRLTSLDLSKNSKLTSLVAYQNRFENIEFKHLKDLTILSISYNKLTGTIDVTNQPQLKELHVGNNNISALVLGDAKALEILSCEKTGITSVDLTKSPKLKYFFCSYNKGIKSIQFADVPELKLEEIQVHGCDLAELDLSKAKKLKKLQCDNIRLQSLDFSNCPNLEYAFCTGNHISGEAMTRMVTSLPDRNTLGTNATAGLLGVYNDALGDNQNQCKVSDVAIAKPKKWRVLQFKSSENKYIDYEGIGGSSNAGDMIKITFAEDAVRNKVELQIDAEEAPKFSGLEGNWEKDQKGNFIRYKITAATATITGKITHFSCEQNEYIDGIEVVDSKYLTTLSTVSTPITSVVLKNCEALEHLNCSTDTQLKDLKITNCANLKEIQAIYTQLEALNTSTIPNLEVLQAPMGRIKKVDLSNNKKLRVLSLMINQLSELDLSPCSNLEIAEADVNTITNINVTNCTKLQKLFCLKNKLASLDLSSCFALDSVDCHINQLKGEQMTRLMQSLPNRVGKSPAGMICIYGSYAGPNEGNECLSSDVTIAKTHNWDVKEWDQANKQFIDYAGKEVANQNIDNAVMRLFPNPATDVVYIEQAAPFTLVTLWSIDGEQLLRLHTGAQGECTLDLRHLSAGTYVITVGEKVNKLVLEK